CAWPGKTPQGVSPRRLPDRPRKACACSGDQQLMQGDSFFSVLMSVTIEGDEKAPGLPAESEYLQRR
ncbi:hypothetical protein, partial [Alkalihalophilus marmarensis]|uniref:hypothetical protein n=1 Tax=Alkalihalophilus marmarensis TaxID=521377 RepID=UPI001F2B6D09